MAENSPTTLATTWATMASRGVPKKVLQPSRKAMDVKDGPSLVGQVLYEDDNLKGQILAHKAMAIVQQALTSGSVLFSFAKGLFRDRFDAYKLIESQISAAVEFRPISLYDHRNDGSLLIEALFDEVCHADKAMTNGVTVNGLVYKACSSRESKESGELKHVQFTLLKISKDPAFIGKLIESLSYYGQVLQVKRFTNGKYFEGKFSAILDTSVGYQVGDEETMEAKPLGRLLYLSEFDCFVSAAYKGAPPVCHFCRRSGHIRAKCPELEQRKCFGCQKTGHMVRFCPEAGGKQPVYLKKQKVSHETAQAQQETVAVMKRVEEEKSGNTETTNKETTDSLNSDNERDSDSDIEVETAYNEAVISSHRDMNKDHFGRDGTDDDMAVDVEDEANEVVMLAGSSALSKTDKKLAPTVPEYMKSSALSKHAPSGIAVNMVIDKPSEMLQLSTLQSRTQERMKALDAKLKAGSRLAASTGGTSKAGDKRPTITRSARGAQ